MKKNTKRFLSLALAMVLVLTNAPLQIFAEGDARPNATVTTLPSTTLEAGEYQVWNGSLTEGTEDLPLQIVMHFKANDTFEQAQASKYAKWRCDFYLTFEGLEGDSVSGDGSYLAGNYGDYGWIKISTDGLEVEEGVEYPVVSNYDANLTYENVCDYVKEFTAALYVNPVILRANPDMKVTLKLKMTDPQNEDNVLVIGKPAVYKAEDLLKMPNATVTTLDPMTLDASEYTVWDGSSLKEGTEAIMLQAVMHFKANDTFEQAQAGGYGKWKCDFYLTFEGLEGGSVSGNGSYLAGNYGSYGWIKIPTDGLEVEEGVEYPIVTNYDANLTYENVCDYVKEFTAALYIDPATLQANPNMKVTLKLKMTNPENPDDVMVIGEPAVYTAQQLLAAKAKPQAEVTILDPITLPAGEYSVYTGSLATGDTARPLQILMNFKAKDSLAQAQAGGYGKWKCDFYLTFEGLEGGSVSGNGSYLAGKYEDGGYDYLGWIVIPTDGLEVEEGVEYPIVSNYDANLTYENICDYVKSFTAALYVNPDVLEANRNMTVTLTLKMTNPDDPTETMIIGEPAVFSSPVLQGYVAHNTDTDKYYEDVNDANNEAKTGETVVLLTDVEVDKLFVSETFDLNGHTLTAKYVACYGSIVDGSDENTGLLKVDPDNILMRKANKQVPIRTEDGYRFVEILGFNTAYQAEKGRFVFQPLFEEYAHELVKAGAEVSGVSIQVNVSWKNAKGETRQQTFVFEDEAFLQGFFDSYKPETGKYGNMFTLVLATTAEVSYQVQVVSDSGTVHASGITAAAAPETTTTTEETTLNTNAEANQASALVPVGTKLSGNATSNSLKLTVENVQNSQSNIVLEDGEVRKSVDVHITGIAPDNTVPTIVTLLAFAEPGMNEGNFALYHVEYGKTKAMTKVAAPADVDTHNEFFYDPATGDVTMALATFSEIAMVSETDKAWEGNFDYSWYTNAVAPLDGESTSVYIIANADQLAAFGAIVGGMNGQTQDSFAGKTVKLVADINLGDKESENKSSIIFYPIGYWNNEGTYERKPLEERTTAVESGFYTFEGTFDGNGHTIANFYQNTWEMKGDHNWYDPIKEQYYRDGMGLFGRVYKGTVKNLTVKNFSSDGEIATTGVIAAYADGATFENIAIMDCNPRVYNIGNGGIVGCVGWYAKEANLKTTFKNITVDNSNKISALWGSYDVACGGMVGQYYPTSGQSSADYPANAGIYFENCHVSAQMDVYNDVCGNYQYYAYRYTGMLIGSIRENVTGEDGHVYPKMDGITASGCTVHFGTWNDYYYCELVANSLASYTHDHQFSRLEQVASVDVENMKVTSLKGETKAIPTSGRVNYVVVTGDHATENATCYHFVDGKVHNHDDYNGDGVEDYETVNGESIRVENNRHIYLEFNNLVTGYGWGVTSKGVGDLAGVTILDREVGNSVEKFEGKVTELTTTKQYKLGDIFNFVDKGVALVPGALMVSVHNLDENNPVSATFVRGTENWENGTITFSGAGKVTITIQDYYFCTPTTIEVTITDRQPKVKFDVVMNNGDFLHRVGNVEAVALDKLFKAKEGVTVGTVSVTVEPMNGTAASGTYTPASTWTNGSIQFNSTGVVKVTITDNDYCIPTVLYLEVVDAKNVTSATDATSSNVVLLNDISSGLTVSGEYTFFGNGFTLNYTGNGQYLNNGLKQGVVTVSENGTLDNLHIKASIYPAAYMYYGYNAYGEYVQGGPSSVEGDKTRYHYQLSAIVAKGNATIQNCYVYGGRTNIFVDTGDVTIKDTVLECGTLANVQIQSANEYTVTLENLTTIQYQVSPTVGDEADRKNVMLGAGIIVGPDTTTNPTVMLNGTFKQYNWVTEDDANAVTNSTGKMIVNGALNATDYNHTINGKKASNLGIIYLNTADTSVTDNTKLGYEMRTVTLEFDGHPVTGRVYSLPSTVTNPIYSDYKNADRSTVNGDYLPTLDFDLGDQEISYDGNEDTRYLYGDKNGLTVLYQDGDAPITLDLTKLATIYKYEGLPYSVTVVCKDSDGKALTQSNGVVNLSVQGQYDIVFTVDDNIFYDKNGETIKKAVTRRYTVPLTLTVKEAQIKNAVVNITKTALDGVYNTVNVTDYELRIKFLDCISITDYDTKGTATNVNLSSNISSATLTPSGVNVFTTASTITITYTDGRVLTVNLSKISGSSPGTKTAKVNTSGSVYFTTEGALNNKPTEASSQNKCTITSVSFKGNSGSTVTNDTDVTVTWALGPSGGTSPCVTPDTLITLADGTQKRIDAVTYADQLLVWDFFKGEYVAAPAAIIFNHGYDNNTIIKLTFSDGTEVKVANLHQFMDADLNKLVDIHADSVEQYVGHRFVKRDGDSYTTVTLTGYTVSEEYVEAYGIISAYHYNILVEDMVSTDFMPEDFAVFNYFEVGEDMMFDQEKMQADIEKYGLYTYADFADYLTPEQFDAFHVQYMKIAVGKGTYTYEGILNLIETYLMQQ